MTKIVHATHRHHHVLEIEFSDGSVGDYDLAPLLAKDTELTRDLDPRHGQSSLEREPRPINPDLIRIVPGDQRCER
jgi:hypothetical protein